MAADAAKLLKRLEQLKSQRAIVEARKGGRGGLCIEPPLYVREAGGGYTADARRALGEAD